MTIEERESHVMSSNRENCFLERMTSSNSHELPNLTHMRNPWQVGAAYQILDYQKVIMTTTTTTTTTVTSTPAATVILLLGICINLTLIPIVNLNCKEFSQEQG
uniref:Uncharacterized protein n=1 Tax=Glossina austeni TaxID=7395 RepID=A0A1A9ULL8_GLOAU